MNQHLIIDEHPALILIFFVIIGVMLMVDLGIFNKKSHEVSKKEAVAWSVVWISLAMIFSRLVYYYAGASKFYEFQSAYWVEKALSVDNLFVFIMIFKFFDVPSANKHRVLFWGIIGALFLRAIFILSGTYLIELTYLNTILSKMGLQKLPYEINILMTIFGLFLVYIGFKSWKTEENEAEDYNNTRGARFIRSIFKVSDKYESDKFFTVENRKRIATPLLVVLAVIEFTDLLFAVDSIPAIFAISKDPFILYSSNIFAILGLRALFFLLDNFIYLFSKLPYGLAIILAFIGLKMLSEPFLHINPIYSLFFIVSVLIISVIVSLLFPTKGNVE